MVIMLTLKLRCLLVIFHFNNGTFDVFIRDFFDNDETVRVIESFTNCSMDPTNNNYVANKIGTSNGEYQVKSKYVMLEMSDEAPTDEKTMLWEELKTRLERLRPEKMMEQKALQAENLNKLLKFRAFQSPYTVI